SGVSANLGLPTWRDLIAHMAKDLGYDVDVFVPPGANFLTISEYYKLAKGSIGPLRSWMDRNWTVPEETLKASRVHNAIVDFDFPLIYTNNYDAILQSIYRLRGKAFAKISNAKDIVTAEHSVSQI